jgi:helicase required for RNAi-mediated heterochromatin assembly 1
VPTVEELSRDDAEVPVNIVDGPYDSVNEYLGTHYELVREDTLSGLRGAIAFIKRNPSSDDTQHVAIYENVGIFMIHWSYSH